MRMMRRSAIILIILVAALTAADMPYGAEPEPVVYKDETDDVLIDSEGRPPESAEDLENIGDEKAPESSETDFLDIVSLTVGGDDTYVRFILDMNGYIISGKEYVYVIAGYSEKDPKRSNKFDFMLRFNNGTMVHMKWGLDTGKFEVAENISNVSIEGNLLNMTVHRSKFSLASREDPYLLCAFVYLDQGEDKEILIDYLITGKEKSEGSSIFQGDTLLMAEIGFFFLVFTALLIIYNIWSNKKGEEIQGGVCPKCESRLDPNLDFCPSCGTVIRGPKSDNIPLTEEQLLEE
jgi:uncharacterized OB-fold protein